MTTDTQTARPCGCLGTGRHRNACPLKMNDATTADDGGSIAAAMDQVAAPPPVVPAAILAPLFCGLPIMPDDEMEQYGGDLAAHESYSERSGRPAATMRSSASASRMQPDLSFRGLLVNRHAPEKRFHFVYNLEDGSSSYQQAVSTLRQRGYKPVTVADFHVHSSLRDGVFIPHDGTATGLLTLGGALKGGMTVVYAQGEADYWRWRKHERRFSDQIQENREQQAASIQQDLAADFPGVTTNATSFE